MNSLASPSLRSPLSLSLFFPFRFKLIVVIRSASTETKICFVVNYRDEYIYICMFFYISAKLVIYASRFKNLNFLFNFLNLRRLYLLEKIFSFLHFCTL